MVQKCSGKQNKTSFKETMRLYTDNINCLALLEYREKCYSNIEKNISGKGYDRQDLAYEKRSA